MPHVASFLNTFILVSPAKNVRLCKLLYVVRLPKTCLRVRIKKTTTIICEKIRNTLDIKLFKRLVKLLGIAVPMMQLYFFCSFFVDDL